MKQKRLKDFERLGTADSWCEYIETMVLSLGRGEPALKSMGLKDLCNAAGKVSQMKFRKIEQSMARREKPDEAFFK